MTIKTDIDFKALESNIDQVEREIDFFMIELKERLVERTPLGRGYLKDGWQFKKTGPGEYEIFNLQPYADYQNYENLRHHPGGTDHSFSEFAVEPRRKRSSYRQPRELLQYQRGYRQAVRTGNFDYNILFFKEESMDDEFVKEFVQDISKKYGITIQVGIV
jgi:hypothetical protein